MNPVTFKSKSALALVIAGLLTLPVALADKPEWAGKGGKHNKSEQRGDRDHDEKREHNDKHKHKPQAGHFEERHNVIVRDYYGEQMRGGHCPPGLAKKNNGCMPPGQAKKYQVGRRLPAEVVYYQVPQPLVTQIGVPPPGYRYIRVGNDILLISSGTGMIIDAIKNFGRG